MHRNAFLGRIKPNLIVIWSTTTNILYTAIQYKNHSGRFYEDNQFEIHQYIMGGDSRKLALLDSKFDIQNIQVQPYTELALNQLASLQDQFKNIFVSQFLPDNSICMMSYVIPPPTNPTPTARPVR